MAKKTVSSTYWSLILQIRSAYEAIENDIGSLMGPNFCVISTNEQFLFGGAFVFWGISSVAYKIHWVNNRFFGR